MPAIAAGIVMTIMESIACFMCDMNSSCLLSASNALIRGINTYVKADMVPSMIQNTLTDTV